MKTLITIIGFFILSINPLLLGQDAAITSVISPNNGCDLTATETVGVVILNNSGVIIPSGSIEVSYSLNGAPAIQQVLNTNLNSGATWNFNFTVDTDLSACQEHEVTAWIDLATDSDPTNDTLTWTVQNDCTVVPGEAVNDLIVCEAGNEDTLELINSVNGYLDDWIYSTDNGTNWSSTGQNDTTYVFNNLTEETIFAIVLDGGFCNSDTSDFATVEIQPVPNGGEIDGSTTVCISDANGTLELLSAVNDILHWESSTDNGSNWDTIPNTTSTENYFNLTETTWFRVAVDGEACPNVYSDTAIIGVDALSDAGILTNDTLICVDEETTLFTSGTLGNIEFWEYSDDNGINWNTISHTDTNYNTGPLTDETIYRVIVKNGVCDEDTSNIVTVDIAPLPFVDAGIDQSIPAGDTTTLNGVGGATGIWTPGTSLSDSSASSPDAFPIETTLYTYTAISLDGCINADSMTVTVTPPEEIPPQFSIKNVITANGDGYNDTWIIEGLELYPENNVVVFNIYGNEVFKEANYQNDWGGTYKGEKLPNGTYLYIVELPGEDQLKGTLTILGNE